MGVQIVKIFLFLLLLSSTAIAQKKVQLQAFREMAYCTCLQENYSLIDSTFVTAYKDVSKTVIFMGLPLSQEVAELVMNYAKEQTREYYKLRSHTTAEVGENANYIALSCLQFYESSHLRKFIKTSMK